MISYKLDNGKVCELPTSAYELKFRQFIDMRSAEQAFYEEGTFGYAAIPVILAAALGDELVNELDFYVPESADTARAIAAAPLQLGSEFDTLSVYCHLLYVIESYEPLADDNILRHDGEEYLLLAQDIIKGEGKVKVGPAIVSLELAKFYQTLIDQRGDIEGNYAFSLGLLEVAALARKRDEMLPLNTNERSKWLETRGKLIEDMPLSEVLKVRFFFLRILRGYTKTQGTQRSGKSQHSVGPKQKKNAKQKPKRKRSPLKNRRY